MKTGIFVERLSNVTRFKDAVHELDARGSREACWLLAEGEPGHGKTRTLEWWAMRNAPNHSPLLVRAKADYTPNWLLSDIAKVLGVDHSHRTRALFNAITAEIMVRQHKAIVIDEINHAARSPKVLEAIRDISDMTECAIIAGGHKGTEAAFKRYPQIHSRLAEIVSFSPLTAADVVTVCETLTDFKIDGSMAQLVRDRTGGSLRLVKNALARVEPVAKKLRGTVTAEAWGGRPLLNSDKKPALQIVPPPEADHG